MTEIIVTADDNELDGVRLRNPPPPTYPALDLEHLTEEERNIIWRVVNRDEAIRLKEEHRINRLKAELQFLKRKSALKPDMENQSNRCCARCRVELGLIINRGALCKMCQLKVCKSCREYNLSGTDWVCSVCQKNLELQLASGEWMNEFVRKPSRRRNKVYVPPSDVVKSGIRRSWTISSPPGTHLPPTENQYRGASFLQVNHTNVSSFPSEPQVNPFPKPPIALPNIDRTQIRRRSSFTTVDHHIRYMKGPAPPPPEQRHSAPLPQNKLAPPEPDYHRTRAPTLGDPTLEAWRFRNSQDADVSSNCTSVSGSPRMRDPSEAPWRGYPRGNLGNPQMKSCQNLSTAGSVRDVRIPRCPSVGSYEDSMESIMLRRRQMMGSHMSVRDTNSLRVRSASPDLVTRGLVSPNTSSEVSPVLIRQNRLKTGSSLYDSGVYEDDPLSSRPTSSVINRNSQRINSDSDQAYGGSSPSQSSADPYFGYQPDLSTSCNQNFYSDKSGQSMLRVNEGRWDSQGSGEINRQRVHPQEVKIELRTGSPVKTNNVRRVEPKPRARPDPGAVNCRYWQRLEEVFDPQFRQACQYVNNDNEAKRSKVEIRADVTSDSLGPRLSDAALRSPVECRSAFDQRKVRPEGDDYKLVFISSDSSRESEMDESFERVPHGPRRGVPPDIGEDNEWDFYEVTNSKLIPLIQRQKYLARRKQAADKKYRLANPGPPLLNIPTPQYVPASLHKNNLGFGTTSTYMPMHNPSPTRSIEEMESTDHTHLVQAEEDVWSLDKSLLLSLSEPNLTEVGAAMQAFLKSDSDQVGANSSRDGQQVAFNYSDESAAVDRRVAELRTSEAGQSPRRVSKLTRSRSSCASLLQNSPQHPAGDMLGRSRTPEAMDHVNNSLRSHDERLVDTSLGFTMSDASKSLSETDLNSWNVKMDNSDRSNPFAGYGSVTKVRIGKLSTSVPRRKHKTSIYRSHSAAGKCPIPVKCYFPSDKPVRPSDTTHFYSDGYLPATNSLTTTFSSSHTPSHISNVEIRKIFHESDRSLRESDRKPAVIRNLRVKSFSESSKPARYMSTESQDGTTRIDLYNHNSVKEKVDIYNTVPIVEKKVNREQSKDGQKVILKFQDVEDSAPGLSDSSLKGLASNVNLSWRNYSNKPFQSSSLPRIKTKFSPVQEYVKIFEQKIGETKGSTLPRAFSHSYNEERCLTISDIDPHKVSRAPKQDNCYANKNSIRIKIAANRSTAGSDVSDGESNTRTNSISTRSNDPMKSKLYAQSQLSSSYDAGKTPLFPSPSGEPASPLPARRYSGGAVGSVHWRTPSSSKRMDPRPVTVGASTDEDEEPSHEKRCNERIPAAARSDETNESVKNCPETEKNTLSMPVASVGDRPEKVASYQLPVDKSVSVYTSRHHTSESGLLAVSGVDPSSKPDHLHQEPAAIVSYYERLRDKEVSDIPCPVISEIEPGPSESLDAEAKSDGSKQDSDTEADFLDKDVKTRTPVVDVTSSAAVDTRESAKHSSLPQTESVSRDDSPREVSPQPVTPFSASLVSDGVGRPVKSEALASDPQQCFHQVKHDNSAPQKDPLPVSLLPAKSYVKMPSPVDVTEPQVNPLSEQVTPEGTDMLDKDTSEDESGDDGEPTHESPPPVLTDVNICAPEREGSERMIGGWISPRLSVDDELLVTRPDDGSVKLRHYSDIVDPCEKTPSSELEPPSHPCDSHESDKIVLNSDSAVTIVNVDFGAKKRTQDGVTVIKINPGSEDQIISSDESLFVSDQAASPSHDRRKQYSVTTLTIGHSSASDEAESGDDMDIQSKYDDSVVTVIHEHGTSGVVKQKMNTLRDRKKFGYKSISESLAPRDLHTNVSQLEELIAQAKEKSSEAWATIKDEQSDSSGDPTVSGLASYFMLSLENSPSVKKTPVVVNRKPVVENKQMSDDDSTEFVEEIPASPDDQSDFVLPSGDEDPENFKVYTTYMEADDESSESDHYERLESAEEMDYCYSDSVSSGDDADFDREEELRGYNRGFDFTLHTIMEESCEESDGDKKRVPSVQHNPSELEKYFCYDIGEGMATEKRFANEESEYSDTFSETSSSVFSEGLDPMEEEDSSIDPAELASSRLEKYFLTDFLGMDRQISFDDEEHSENQSDENGSVGSDSEGQPSPEQKRKKVMKTRAHRSNSHENVLRAFVFRSDSLGSEESNYSNDGEDAKKSIEVERSHGENEEEKAFEKSDGQFDTIKRRKKKKSCSDFSEPKSDSDRKSENDKKISYSPTQSTDETALDNASIDSPAHKMSNLASLLSVDPTLTGGKHQMGFKLDRQDSVKVVEGDEKPQDTGLPLNASRASSERRKLRDSGFVGSSDDLLKDTVEKSSFSEDNSQEGPVETILEREVSPYSDIELAAPSVPGGVSDHQEGTDPLAVGTESEKTSTEDKDSTEGVGSVPSGKSSRSSSTTDSPASPLKNRCKVIRKDSFNNWSSDEETNLMMSKMRVFFRNLFTGNNKGQKVKSPQLVEFEARLTTLMKTVPGINDEQVKEIVEYLSSEDTWSDSYDSSDYTSSDLEGAYAVLKLPEQDLNPEIQQQISASCQEIIQKFDQSLDDSPESDGFRSPTNSDSSTKETALVYQKLLSSFSKMGVLDNSCKSPQTCYVQGSPPLIAKVFHHIGNRLVDLMHEVSNGESQPQQDAEPKLTVKCDMIEQFTTSSPKGKSTRSRKYRKYPISPSEIGSQANYFSFEHTQSYSDFTSDSDEASTPKATPKSPEFISPASTLKRDSNFSSPASTLEKPLNIEREKVMDDVGDTGAIIVASEEPLTSLSPVNSQRVEVTGETKDLSPPMILRTAHDKVEVSLTSYSMSSKKSESLNDLLEPNKMSDFSSSECLSDSTLKALDSVEHLSSDYQASWMSDETLDDRKSKSTQNVSTRLLSPGRPEETSVSESDLSVTKSGSDRKLRPKLLDVQSKRRKSVPDTSASETDKSSSGDQLMPDTHSSVSGSPAIISSSPSPSTASVGVRSARYRPPGYRPPPISPRRSAVNLSSHSYGSFTNSEDSTSHLSGESISATMSSSENISSLAPPEVTIAGSTEEDIDRWVSIHKKDHPTPTVTRSDSVSSVCSVVSDIQGAVNTVPVRGEIQLAMQYNPQSAALEILIKQCRDLAPVDTKRNRSDPYVKVYLLPDKTKSGKRKTKVKKHTLNPVFDECLRFPCVRSELNTRSVWVTVWHSDMFGRNDFLGEVSVELDEPSMTGPAPKWYKLQERVESLLCDATSLKLGNVIVALKYLPADKSDRKTIKSTFPATTASHGSLQVLVKEAKNLKPIQGQCDAFCKCYLLPERGRNSKQKTVIVRRTVNPSWSHTFAYDDMAYDELKDKCIELSVWDHDRLSSNTFLGGVRLNLGCGKINGKPVDWMDSNDEESSLWRSMIERPAMWVQASLPLRNVVNKHIS